VELQNSDRPILWYKMSPSPCDQPKPPPSTPPHIPNFRLSGLKITVEPCPCSVNRCMRNDEYRVDRKHTVLHIIHAMVLLTVRPENTAGIFPGERR
jgi:hypothetical protein